MGLYMRVLGQMVVMIAASVLCLMLSGAMSKVYAAAPGEVEPWTTSANPLPSGKFQGRSATYNGFIYVMSGSGGSSGDTVYYAPISPDGSVGAWVTSSNTLPLVLTGAGATAHNGYLYVIGGDAGGPNRSDLVFYAHINPDGSVGAWTTAPNPTPQPMMDMTVSTYNGYLYTAGGINATTGILNAVFYAPLNPDGSIGTWVTSGNSLPYPRTTHTSVIYNGYWYILGGLDDNWNLVNDVSYAPISPDGSVGAWVNSGTNLPIALGYITSAVYDGYIFTFSGYDPNNGSGIPYDYVYSAPISANGSVGSWTASSNPLPQALFGMTASMYNGFVYVIGGYDNASFFSPAVYHTRLTGYPKPVISTQTASATAGSGVTVTAPKTGSGEPASSTSATLLTVVGAVSITAGLAMLRRQNR
jgi:N-acetylneuraminic acid mutarotase